MQFKLMVKNSDNKLQRRSENYNLSRAFRVYYCLRSLPPKLSNLTLYTNLPRYFICIIEVPISREVRQICVDNVQQTETDPLRVGTRYYK